MTGNSRRLLLQAALAENGRALTAWREWLSRVDWERNAIDHGSFSLLPLVYHNLTRKDPAGVDSDPEMRQKNGDGLGRLRGIYRRSWVVNETNLRSVGSALQRLGKEGISCLLPDGAALAMRFYPHPACRPVVTQTLWIETGPAASALLFLEQVGWRVATRLPLFMADIRNRARRLWPLRDENGFLLLLRLRSRTGQDSWQASDVETLLVAGGAGNVLAPAGQLLELGRQARHGSPDLRPSLLADAACLIRSAQPRIDWPRVRRDRAVMTLMRQLVLIDPEWEERWRE